MPSFETCSWFRTIRSIADAMQPIRVATNRSPFTTRMAASFSSRRKCPIATMQLPARSPRTPVAPACMSLSSRECLRPTRPLRSAQTFSSSPTPVAPSTQAQSLKTSVPTFEKLPVKQQLENRAKAKVAKHGQYQAACCHKFS